MTFKYANITIHIFERKTIKYFPFQASNTYDAKLFTAVIVDRLCLYLLKVSVNNIEIRVTQCKEISLGQLNHWFLFWMLASIRKTPLLLLFKL